MRVENENKNREDQAKIYAEKMKSEGELKKLQDLNDELQSQISVLQASLSAAEKAAQETASKERPPQPNH